MSARMPGEPQTTTKDGAAPDSVCAAAVDLARHALEEITEAANIGDHKGATADGERIVTHRFECRLPAYVGWQWAVSVARVPRARTATVCETVLLPGPGALTVPEWTPWSERLRAGDIGVGDLLPTSPDDSRLIPGYTAEGDVESAELDEILMPPQWELGLGREQVLSPYGRDDASFRWYAGERGPDSAMAQAAPATCATCGFMLPIGGPLGQLFAVCANEYSPADGSLVAINYGCGGHSSIRPIEGANQAVGDAVIDHVGFDAVDVSESSETEDEQLATESAVAPTDEEDESGATE
jgi:hypothetical protein